MKLTRKITVTHVERTLVLNVPLRCPHCGGEVPVPAGPAPAPRLAGDEVVVRQKKRRLLPRGDKVGTPK